MLFCCNSGHYFTQVRALRFLSYFSILVLSANNAAFAAFKLSPRQPVLTFSGGGVFAQPAKDMSFVVGDSTYSYKAHSAGSSSWLAGAFLGAALTLDAPADLQIGFGCYQTGQIKASGKITQGIDPQSSDTYPYKYNVSTGQLLVEGKLLALREQFYHPYVTAGVGASFSRVSSYKVDYPVFLTFTPLYIDNASTAFTYSLGFGVDVEAGKHRRIGIGYRFNDLGRANFGQGFLDVLIPESLGNPKLYASQVLVQFTLY